VFANQDPTDVAVVPRGYERELQAQRIEYDRADAHEVRLRGRHNLENAGAARAVARARGIDEEAISEALSTFGGVPHRLEEVAVVDGVTYINDSKATNIASTLVALEGVGHGIHVILGGDDAKGEDFGLLRDDLVARARAAYLIGDAAQRLHDDLLGSVPLVDAGTLDIAVERASAAAREGEFVLLSPACASYDQFRNFEERGERFRELVEDGVRPRL
jgi:UDP-N-acetylmuramoylalanine--D-glutamate ligase